MDNKLEYFTLKEQTRLNDLLAEIEQNSPVEELPKVGVALDLQLDALLVEIEQKSPVKHSPNAFVNQDTLTGVKTELPLLKEAGQNLDAKNMAIPGVENDHSNTNQLELVQPDEQRTEINEDINQAEYDSKIANFEKKLAELYSSFFNKSLDLKLRKYREENQRIQNGNFSVAIKAHVERKLNLFEDFVKRFRFKLDLIELNSSELLEKNSGVLPSFSSVGVLSNTGRSADDLLREFTVKFENPTSPEKKPNKFLSIKAVGALAAAVGVGMFAWSNLNKQNPIVTENPKNPVQVTQVQVAENLPTNPIRVTQVEPTQTPKIVSESKLTKPAVTLTKTPKVVREKPKVIPPRSIPSPANLSPQKIKSESKMVALGDITGSLTLPVTPEKKYESVRENVVKVAPNRPLVKSIQQQRIIINTKIKNIAVIVPAEIPSFPSDFPKKIESVETDTNRMDEIYNGDNNQPTPINTKPVQSTTSFISKGVRFSIK
jgi:hypothetical protein